MTTRIVITGAGGQVGSLLATEAVQQGRDVLALTSSQWDITDPQAADQIVQSGDVVINCAAYTNVDGAEGDQATAYAVNAAGPEHIAQACARAGARLVHISTDYVFSGDFGGSAPHPYEPDDETAPLSVYGRTKLAGERAVLAALPQAVVVRTRLGLHRRNRQGLRRRHAQAGRRRWHRRGGRRPGRLADLRRPIWSARCCRWPTGKCTHRSCMPPTRARYPASGKPARCSRASAPTRSGCCRSAAPQSAAGAEAAVFGAVRSPVGAGRPVAAETMAGRAGRGAVRGAGR